jgi:hypothetical protein
MYEVFKHEELTLPIILEQISDIGNKLHWSILFLHSAGHLGEDKPIPEFEKYIFNTPEGYTLEWDELIQMANKFEYIIDLLLVASTNENTFFSFTAGCRKDNYKSVCDILIEIDDGDFTKFFTKDKATADRIQKYFGPLPGPSQIGVYRSLRK